MEERTWADDVAVPALLRVARSTYSKATRAVLAEMGADDLPRNGPFVLGAIARTGAPLAAIIDDLGVSKQAAGQLVDTLVLRGYLDREVDPDDRRRLRVSLTERGAATAAVIRGSIEGVDERLAAEIGAGGVTDLRRSLAAIIALGAG
jgi:DNA-binding MarR family transcriptional regulator